MNPLFIIFILLPVLTAAVRTLEEPIKCSHLCSERIHCKLAEISVFAELDFESANTIWSAGPTDLNLSYDNTSRIVSATWRGPNDASIQFLKAFEITLGVPYYGATTYRRYIMDIRNSSRYLLRHKKTLFTIKCMVSDTLFGPVAVLVNTLPRPNDTDIKEDCRCLYKSVNIPYTSKKEREIGFGTRQIVNISVAIESSTTQGNVDSLLETDNSTMQTVVGSVVPVFVLSGVFVAALCIQRGFLKNRRNQPKDIKDPTENEALVKSSKVVIMYSAKSQQCEIEIIKALTALMVEYCSTLDIKAICCTSRQLNAEDVDTSDFIIIPDTYANLLIYEYLISEKNISKVVIISLGSNSYNIDSGKNLHPQSFILLSEMRDFLLHIHGSDSTEFTVTDFQCPEDILKTNEGANLIRKIDLCEDSRWTPPSEITSDINSADFEFQTKLINERTYNNWQNEEFDFQVKDLNLDKQDDCSTIGGDSI